MIIFGKIEFPGPVKRARTASIIKKFKFYNKTISNRFSSEEDQPDDSSSSTRRVKKKKKKNKSLLTYQLENLPELPANPFEVFSKFGAAGVAAKEKTRTLRIFLVSSGRFFFSEGLVLITKVLRKAYERLRIKCFTCDFHQQSLG